MRGGVRATYVQGGGCPPPCAGGWARRDSAGLGGAGLLAVDGLDGDGAKARRALVTGVRAVQCLLALA